MDEEIKNPSVIKQHPLWMPEGSVRAILVIGSLLTVMIPVFVFVFRGENYDVPQGVKEIIIFVAGGSITLIKDYIVGRTKQNGDSNA